MTMSGESSAKPQEAYRAALSGWLRQAGYSVATTSRRPSERRSNRSGSLSEIVVLDPARIGMSGPELHHRIHEAGLGQAIAFTARRVNRPAETRLGIEGVGRLRVDAAGRRIFVDDTELRLSPKERDLLAYMLRRPGVALTRTQILHDVWGRDGSEVAKTVDVHVRWLRQRLASHEPPGVKIVTVRGTGYRLDLTG